MISHFIHSIKSALKPVRQLWHPTPIFGAVLIAFAWAAAINKTTSDAQTASADAKADLNNLTQLMSQDVQRTIDELDRTLRFLRRSHERSSHDADWVDLVQEDYTINSRTLQIAIIDAAGKMITSSAMLRPKTPVDLSDREHYTFHKTNPDDVLYVSRPLIGRATGKWSIQFTRKFFTRDKRFDGVIVASLNPEQVLSVYERLHAFDRAGFALIGKDDVIRAGAGTYAQMIGKSLVDGSEQRLLLSKDPDVTLTEQTIDGQPRLVAIRPVKGSSLSVVVSLADSARGKEDSTNPYFLFASLVTAAVGFAVFASMRQHRRHVRNMRQLANDDTLTRLPNRLAFQTAIERHLHDADGVPNFALHLIDLDEFKAVNDTFGHPVGDELLRNVAHRLTAAVRNTDVAYRLGGDEFALIQTHTTEAAQVEAVARRICRVLSEPFDISGHRLLIGASIGIAMRSPELSETTQILQAADIALYRSKSQGRGRFTVYDCELGIQLLRRKQLEAELRQAIVDEALELHYQPKVLLGQGAKVAGYEALVRWNHPTRGLLPPGQFIDLAEETGLIVPLGNWAIEHVCQNFSGRADGTTVAVNCSAMQFATHNVADVVRRALERSGLEPQRLEIEITETMLMRGERTIVRQLEEIRAMGVRISLDDFGTGYSSLAYIEKYPIDCIKIDRTFIAKITKEPRAIAITRAIIALAAELNMTAVAEGIETLEQADILRGLGCQYGQGYFFGKPQPASTIWPDASKQVSAASA